MNPTRDSILATLRALKPRLAERYGVTLVGIVGSWARGDAGPDSDLDVAYEIEQGTGRTLLDVGGAYGDLLLALGREVDLIDWTWLDPRYRVTMARDMERLDG